MTTATPIDISTAELEQAIVRHGGTLTTPDEAVAIVRSGDRVMIPIGSQPLALADALAAHLATIDGRGAEMADCAVAGNYLWLKPGFPGVSSVVHEHWGGPAVRHEQRRGEHDYLPIPFSLRFKALDERSRTAAEIRRADVVLVQVTLPDEHGYVSFGPNAWNQQAFCREAKYAIGEMSGHIPHVFGQGHTMHVSDFHVLVLNDSPRRMTTVPEANAQQRRIAGFLSEIVEDGDTIQVGAGTVPAAAVYAGAFDGKLDLGWHSEATIGGIIDLIRDGVFTGARKTIDQGLAVATGYAGNQEQMDFVRLHPLIHTRPTDYVHNIRTIAGQDNMVAVNAAMFVDLTGQICADSIGHEMIGGTGGQLEFALGAVNARNGRSVTLLEATAVAGSASRIVASLPIGTIVSVPRLYADIVITEFGIARLWGKTVRERTRELIAIAHPGFRAELAQDAARLFGA